ncbi:MAG TPA: hypothetical protein VHC97_07005 [Thermoanaerobaculia bacterium]|nr:hypothetical protein [Thermoanaerobaculia bacterium]
MLTVQEFIRLAADRGVKLEVMEIGRRRVLTNGTIFYPLSLFLDEEIPDDIRNSLCHLFRLPYLDFALDQSSED